jgi:DUF1009 family protein
MGEISYKLPVSTRRKRMLFDVLWPGRRKITVMRQCGATSLALDAGRTLFLDRAEMLANADAWGISVAGYPPVD